ncbi:MAG TPA: FAD-binding protein, partial [Arenibaculum sp.]|nr:FAD-binding protein [Arenibaculum sp.]
MGTTIRPDSAEAILEAVAWAAASDTPLEIIGHGSRRAIGAPMNTEHTIDLTHMTGVTLDEPAELVLSARAGTPMSEITKLLRDNNQDLAFEPPDPSRLLGGYRGRGTIGGVLASNMSGPRRIKAGAVRDHILGVHAISGRGERFKSGGR